MSDRDIQLIFRELRSQGRTPVDLMVEMWNNFAPKERAEAVRRFGLVDLVVRAWSAMTDEERDMVCAQAIPQIRIVVPWSNLVLQSGQFTSTVHHTPRSPADTGEPIIESPMPAPNLGECEWEDEECTNPATEVRDSEWGDLLVCHDHLYGLLEKEILNINTWVIQDHE